MFGLSTLVSRIIMGLVALVLVFGVLQVRSCHLARQKAAESRLERHQAKAAAKSAQDAIATQEAATERERAIEQATTDNAKEIRNAQGADVVIHPNVSTAGLRALCARPAYRDTERCRLHRANPK